MSRAPSSPPTPSSPRHGASAPASAARVGRASAWKAWVVITSAAVLAALVIAHAPGMNGPWYWTWTWRRLEPRRLYPLMLLGLLPFIAAQVVATRATFGDRRKMAMAVGLLMLATLTLEFAASAAQDKPMGFSHAIRAVESPMVTSYFSDAAELVSGPGRLRQWLQVWPQLMPQMYLHSQEKPPGPVLYHVLFIRLLGVSDRAALVAGLVIGLLATLSVLAAYWFLGLLAPRDAAFFGASFVALCPGLVLFFPMFDQVYPALACALLGTWVRAMRHNRMRDAILFGLVLALITFCAYNLLVLGAFIVGYTAILALAQPKRTFVRATRQATVAILVLLVVHVLLFATLRYDPVGTFNAALQNQKHLLAQWNRSYPQTIPFDLLDFLLGAGWVGGLLAILYFIQREQSLRNESNESLTALAAIAVGQIVLVALSGLLQTETARVWAFMLPLLAMPVGLELARWTIWARYAAFAALFVLTVVIAQNMTFLKVGEG